LHRNTKRDAHPFILLVNCVEERRWEEEDGGGCRARERGRGACCDYPLKFGFYTSVNEEEVFEKGLARAHALELRNQMSKRDMDAIRVSRSLPMATARPVNTIATLVPRDVSECTGDLTDAGEPWIRCTLLDITRGLADRVSDRSDGTLWRVSRKVDKDRCAIRAAVDVLFRAARDMASEFVPVLAAAPKMRQAIASAYGVLHSGAAPIVYPLGHPISEVPRERVVIANAAEMMRSVWDVASAACYVDLAIKKNHLFLTEANRVDACFLGCMFAHKYLEDIAMSNAALAECGAIRADRLLRLELDMMRAIDAEYNIDPRRLFKYHDSLLEVACVVVRWKTLEEAIVQADRRYGFHSIRTTERPCRRRRCQPPTQEREPGPCSASGQMRQLGCASTRRRASSASSSSSSTSSASSFRSPRGPLLPPPPLSAVLYGAMSSGLIERREGGGASAAGSGRGDDDDDNDNDAAAVAFAATPVSKRAKSVACTEAERMSAYGCDEEGAAGDDYGIDTTDDAFGPEWWYRWFSSCSECLCRADAERAGDPQVCGCGPSGIELVLEREAAERVECLLFSRHFERDADKVPFADPLLPPELPPPSVERWPLEYLPASPAQAPFCLDQSEPKKRVFAVAWGPSSRSKDMAWLGAAMAMHRLQKSGSSAVLDGPEMGECEAIGRKRRAEQAASDAVRRFRDASAAAATAATAAATTAAAGSSDAKEAMPPRPLGPAPVPR
jgi:hypothetical protein